MVYEGGTYRLEPTVVVPYDLLRRIEEPSSEYERLLSRLEEDFRDTARTEMYRREKGWIIRGVSERKIKRIELAGRTLLVPVLSEPAVGIDTSGVEDASIIVVCCLDNYKAGISFLEKHLSLPKAKSPVEYKWNKLRSTYRVRVMENFNLLLNISSRGLLVIHTDVLVSPVGSRIYAFRDLIEGCFTGYEQMPSQPRQVREQIRQRFFEMCNNTPIHPDADFRPLTSDKIVRFLVKILSKKDGKMQDCSPLYAALKSEESLPIQITDIIGGAVGTKIRKGERPPMPLTHLFFDYRKIAKKARKKGKFAKAYYWFRE